MHAFRDTTECVPRHYEPSGAATAIMVEQTFRMLGLPSSYALGIAIGHTQPGRVRSWWINGLHAPSGVFQSRMVYLLLLKLHNPEYWTADRMLKLGRGILFDDFGETGSYSWETIEDHPMALNLPSEVVEQRERVAKRQTVRAEARRGVTHFSGDSNRPLIT